MAFFHELKAFKEMFSLIGLIGLGSENADFADPLEGGGGQGPTRWCNIWMGNKLKVEKYENIGENIVNELYRTLYDPIGWFLFWKFDFSVIGMFPKSSIQLYDIRT